MKETESHATLHERLGGERADRGLGKELLYVTERSRSLVTFTEICQHQNP
jgi:hypothetical protein